MQHFRLCSRRAVRPVCSALRDHDGEEAAGGGPATRSTTPASASPHTTPTGHDMTPRDAKRLRVAFDGTPERRRRVPVPTSTARRPLRRQNAVVVEEPDELPPTIAATAAEAT